MDGELCQTPYVNESQREVNRPYLDMLKHLSLCALLLLLLLLLLSLLLLGCA